MLREFTFSSRTVISDIKPGKILYECSCEIGEYDATGFHFQPSRQNYGRPEVIRHSFNVERFPAQDTRSKDPTQNATGGEYDYTAYKVL